MRRPDFEISPATQLSLFLSTFYTLRSILIFFILFSFFLCCFFIIYFFNFKAWFTSLFLFLILLRSQIRVCDPVFSLVGSIYILCFHKTKHCYTLAYIIPSPSFLSISTPSLLFSSYHFNQTKPLSLMDYYTEKMQHGGLGFREYVEALEEERRKIQVFQRELPLCLELVNQAIDACRQQMSATTTENNLHGQSESSEQTTSNEVVPAFEEFIPMKRSSDLSDDDEEEHSHDEDKREKTNNNDNNNDKKKSDWLRSVQLWHPSSDPPLKEDVPRKTTVMEVKRNGGAFQPFHREKSVGKSNVSVVGKLPAQAPVAAPAVAVATTSSSAETASGGRGGGGGSERRDEKDGQSQRKQRRNWSPELHKRFVNALHQLGGSHAATPKQIRELMKVDGLTNDEVKSHLQKYRLHTRRPSPTTIHNNGNPQAPQFVVVGGIWVQPPEYSAAVTATTTSGEVYAPMAAVPAVQPASSSQIQRLQKDPSSQSDERFSHGGNRGCSNSPATSSSTHTTTTSPVF